MTAPIIIDGKEYHICGRTSYPPWQRQETEIALAPDGIRGLLDGWIWKPESEVKAKWPAALKDWEECSI